MEDKVRGLARSIAELFDDLLDDHGIRVPDPDRTGDETEAAIYGCTYGKLVDDIAETISAVFPAEAKKTQEEGICPVCGSQISYGSFELIDEGGVYHWDCHSCGASGKEGYDLIFDGRQYDVQLADGTPFKKEDK